MSTPPGSAPHPTPSAAGPMQAALDVELTRLETMAIKANLVCAGLVIVLSVMARVLVDSRVALFNIAAAAAAACIFVVELRFVGSLRAVRVMQWLNPFIEVTAPTVLLVALASRVSADAALTSGPAIIGYAFPLVVSVLRLRPAVCVAVGVVGALEYLPYAHLVLVPGLSPALLSTEHVRIPMVYANAGVILAGGVVAALVSAALRYAVSAAHREVRSQDLFGKYQLEAPVAEGGMGVVFRATYCPEGGFRRTVAVKRIHAHLARDQRFVRAFREEAELCSRLAHPNIVQVLDFGMLGDSYFFAMDYVDGWPLSTILHRASAAGMQVPLPVARHVAREMLAGLAHAQEDATDSAGKPLRIVHRDLTPSNILVSRGGHVKIADFGIAKALGAADATDTQTVRGKTAYMAPEQARAEKLDGRCDLFAAGAVLWEMSAGRPLFRRATDSATLIALLQEPIPRPGQASGRELPPAWEALVLRALERDPRDRWPSAREMLGALDALEDGERGDASLVAAFAARVMGTPVMAAGDAPTPQPPQGGTLAEPTLSA